MEARDGVPSDGLRYKSIAMLQDLRRADPVTKELRDNKLVIGRDRS